MGVNETGVGVSECESKSECVNMSECESECERVSVSK